MSPREADTVLLAGRAIITTAEEPVGPVAIAVAGGRTVLDPGSRTVLPGVVDPHAHVVDAAARPVRLGQA